MRRTGTGACQSRKTLWGQQRENVLIRKRYLSALLLKQFTLSALHTFDVHASNGAFSNRFARGMKDVGSVVLLDAATILNLCASGEEAAVKLTWTILSLRFVVHDATAMI